MVEMVPNLELQHKNNQPNFFRNVNHLTVNRNFISPQMAFRSTEKKFDIQNKTKHHGLVFSIIQNKNSIERVFARIFSSKRCPFPRLISGNVFSIEVVIEPV